VGDQKCDIFPGDNFLYDFNAFYEQCLNCVFSVHAIRTAHDYFIIVTHMLHLSTKKYYQSCALVIRNCYYLPPLPQLRFFFTNKLSASSIVVLCSDQKLITISREEIDIIIKITIFFSKIKSVFFSKIESKLIKTFKKLRPHYYYRAADSACYR